MMQVIAHKSVVFLHLKKDRLMKSSVPNGIGRLQGRSTGNANVRIDLS